MNAIVDSLAELRQWLPWARNEPEPVEAKAQRLRRFRVQFDRGSSLLYGVFTPDEEIVLGAIGMHARIGAGAREIGYWIRTSHARKGLATEAAGALCRMGFEALRLRQVEIHCHPRNLASAAIPHKLGFDHAVTISNCVPNAATAPRDTQIWTMTASSYLNSEAVKSNLQCFDALGQSVQLLPARAATAADGAA